MSPEIFVQVLINAICTGGLYGLFSAGFTFQFGALKIADVSYGSWMMVAMYMMFVLRSKMKMNFVLAVLVVLVIFFFIGYAMRKFLFARCGDNVSVQMISTMAANFIIMNTVEFIFKQTPRSTGMREKYLDFGNITVSGTRFAILILAIVVLLSFNLFLNKTWTGRSIRGIVQQKRIATVMGVNADKTLNVAYGMGYMMAALGGCMLAIFIPITPFCGAYYQTLSFIICVAAGANYLKGALFVGIIVGVIEAFLQFFTAQFTMPALFTFFVLALVFRPNGLFSDSSKRS